MKPITLNLASRPFRNNVLIGSLLTVIGVGLVAATGYNLYVFLGYGNAYARLQQEQAEDRARIAMIQIEERALAEEIRARNFRQAYERGKLASELVRKSAFSWTDLFNTLEGVIPPDVVTTAIRPNISADAIVIRIEGVAKNSGAFLSLQDRLLKSPQFTRVYPSSERRLNPNLPDITFLLTCNYLPQAPPPGDLVAVAAPGTGTPSDAAPPDAAPVAAVPVPGAPGSAPVTAAAVPAPGEGAGAPADAGAPVGRDGRPVGVATGPILAPGALHTPPGEAAPPAAGATRGGARRSTAQGKAEPGASRGAPSGPAAAPTAAHPAPAGATAAPAGGATGKTVPAGGAAAPAPRGGGPVRTTADGRVWDPNLPRTMPAPRRAALAAQPKAPERPVSATRLDLPLSFAAAPAGDIYRRLGEAHGVRFEFAPGADLAARLTLNLQGRNLEDALALVAGQTRHRVRRLGDGRYRVEGPESGHALAVRPVVEEPLGGEAP